MNSDTTKQVCFHCGEALPAHPPTALINDQEQPFCCHGCLAVAQLVAGAGLDRYYRLREAPAPRVDAVAEPWQAYDRESQLNQVSKSVAGGREALLHLDGVRCAACSWLLQQLAQRTPGIVSLEVNPATARARAVWDPEQMPLSELLSTIHQWGYRPTPESGREMIDAQRREARQATKRLAVAGIGMMQVMMYTIGLYAGDFQGMHVTMRDGLRWFSLVISIPVLWYAGWPILANAWHGLRAARPVMDQPVALALILAWTMSVWHTANANGDVYFEAVTMFVFFLTLARFVEMRARHRSAASGRRLSSAGLTLAKRLNSEGATTAVGADELNPGDQVVLEHGDRVPADGVIKTGTVAVDESLLTGEALPLQRGGGSNLLAGSLILSGTAILRVQATAAESGLGHLQHLLRRAESQRPSWSALADRVAGGFIIGVLILATLVGLYWFNKQPDQAFSIVLSVLVITCPCALSLAAPAALAAATGQLSRRGIFVAGAEALGRLSRADVILLDKTGTLTQGRFQRTAVETLGARDEESCLALAARLLYGSRHPVATAFGDITVIDGVDAVNDFQETPGEGVSGMIDGHGYRLGRPEFAMPDKTWPGNKKGIEQGGTHLALADGNGPLALFTLMDQLRPGVIPALLTLRAAGLELRIVSGDRPPAVRDLADQLQVAQWMAEARPEDKMKLALALQNEGLRVIMVGDGINDAPVLAAADVSITLAHGAAIPKSRADVILTGRSLWQLVDLWHSARQTDKVIRQNLIWALAYNLFAVPAAAMGYVVPWLAALGMSISSLVVVLNALRAGRRPGRQNNDALKTAKEAVI